MKNGNFIYRSGNIDGDGILGDRIVAKSFMKAFQQGAFAGGVFGAGEHVRD